MIAEASDAADNSVVPLGAPKPPDHRRAGAKTRRFHGIGRLGQLIATRVELPAHSGRTIEAPLDAVRAA